MQPEIAHNEGAEYFFREGCHIREWWNRPQDGAASVARARVEPGVTTRWHRLRGVSERYVVLAGEGRVDVGEAGAVRSEMLGHGSVVYIPPGCPQRITNTGAQDLVFLAICTPRFLPDCYEELESV